MNISCFMMEPVGDNLFLRLDTKDTMFLAAAPFGAMWFAPWMTHSPWTNQDGPPLIVKTPGGDWNLDSRANNCGRREDTTHRCWVRHGTAPNITVDKNGDTCSCGCSIGMGNYHGFLRNGILVDA